eukprot:2090664-Rhodomonas_salina.1
MSAVAACTAHGATQDGGEALCRAVNLEAAPRFPGDAAAAPSSCLDPFTCRGHPQRHCGRATAVRTHH